MQQEIVLSEEDQSIARAETVEGGILSVIAAAARDPRVDVEKMAALLQLQERLEQRNAKAEYNAAMARLQPKLPRVKKNGSIDLGRGNPIPFAKWEDVDAVIRPILTEYGFSLSFPTRTEGGQLIMACVVSHIGGHSERSETSVSPDSGPGRNSTQAIGSGRSYAKRYLALDMLNIVTEGADDNGRGAGFITIEQADQIRDMISECEMGKERVAKLLEFANTDRVDHIQSRDLERVIGALNKALRQKREAAK